MRWTFIIVLSFASAAAGWPLAQRWDALTTMSQFEGDPTFPTGYALTTPQGLVHLSHGRPGLRSLNPAAIADLWFRGSSIGHNRGWSFAVAEKQQLAEAAKRRSAEEIQK